MHKGCLLSLSFAWFWLCVAFWESLGLSLISLPWNYALVAIAGLLVGTFGTFKNYGAFFFEKWLAKDSRFLCQIKLSGRCNYILCYRAYFATKDKETSRLFLLFFVLSSWPIVVLANFALPGVFKRFIGFRGDVRKTIIIGYSESLDDLSSWIKAQEIQGFSFVGCFSTSSKRPSVNEVKYLGQVDELKNFLNENKVHQLVVVPDRKKESWVGKVADLASEHGCRMLIYNTLSGLFDARLVFVEESGRQFFTLLNEPLDSPFNQMIKRVFDLFLSVPALVVLFPCSLS